MRTQPYTCYVMFGVSKPTNWQYTGVISAGESMHPMKRLLVTLVLSTLCAAGVATLPSAAQAGPPPPSNCGYHVYGAENAAVAWCTAGYGWYRAVARCMNDYGQRTSYYGPWYPVEGPIRSKTSVAWCTSAYPYVYGGAYQTQGV
jgi:hypothetical protein